MQIVKINKNEFRVMYYKLKNNIVFSKQMKNSISAEKRDQIDFFFKKKVSK